VVGLQGVVALPDGRPCGGGRAARGRRHPEVVGDEGVGVGPPGAAHPLVTPEDGTVDAEALGPQVLVVNSMIRGTLNG
jgi:hypothetical protein